MTSQDNSTNSAADAKRRSASDDSIARLMRLAGPRPAIPEEVRNRVHDRVTKEWRSAVAQRRSVRWGIPVLLAAAVVLAVALSWRRVDAPHVPVATVALVETAAGARGYHLSVDDEIYAGDTVLTGDRGVALTTTSGLSLRLAARTTATFDAADELTVASGRVYADTGPTIREQSSITVHTGVGSAKDMGTQFAVAFLDGRMNVAVREGRVDVSDHRDTYTAEAGDRLILRRNAEVVFDDVSPYDSSWNWASALAPAFDIENRPLFDFLQWAARETGRELVFANDSVRTAALATRLSGSVSGFTPSEAIASVLTTTRFRYDEEGRRIIVDFAQ